MRMTVCVFALLLLVQLPRLFASGFDIQSEVCGSDHLVYSISHGDEVFFVNGIIVDGDLFCKALRFHYANNCIFESRHIISCCGLYSSSVDLNLKKGRKILQRDADQDIPQAEKNDHRKFSNPKQLGFAAAGIVALSCVLVCPCFFKKRRLSSHSVLSREPISMDSVSPPDSNHGPEKVLPSPLRVPPSPRFSISPKVARLGSVHLNLSQVRHATQNFSRSLQIGEGGFGTVYKAQLEDGQFVAIKRAKKEHYESLQNEFSSEVELLAKIDHRNLVKLLGYVDKGNERLIITEYVPNGTLREHLDGQRGKILDFNKRLEIAIDVAHALTYLHTYAGKQIIHRDVKSSNILLTESMRAKVADFGFARLGPVDADQTHISTKVKGTVGYLDPEYMKTYQLTPKSDVYSFGILLLETLTGRRPVELKRPPDERVTLRWAFRKYNEGAVVDIVDPLMEERVHGEVLSKIFALGIQCAAPIRTDRPDMQTVGQQLWAIRADYIKSCKRG